VVDAFAYVLVDYLRQSYASRSEWRFTKSPATVHTHMRRTNHFSIFFGSTVGANMITWHTDSAAL